MSFADTFLPEFDQEMAATRRTLERVPTEKGQWKPHPKSFPLGHLAQLVSNMPGWFTNVATETALDLSTGPRYTFEPTEALLRTFDRNVTEARAALAATSDAGLATPWSLTAGGQVLMTLPRGTVLRQTMSHLVHHRAQLGVYLRLLDVPVPSIYGPSADDNPWRG